MAVKLALSIQTKQFRNIFSGPRRNEPNFKILCNCIHELLNVFEDPAQRECTVVVYDCVHVCTCVCSVCMRVCVFVGTFQHLMRVCI